MRTLSLRLAIFWVLFFVSILPLTAQRRMITGTDYIAGTSQIYSKADAHSRHVETTEEHLENGAVTKSIYTVIEALMPDRTRTYVKTIQEGQITESEVIKIAYMRYERHNGGPWTKLDLRQSGNGSGYGSGTGALRNECNQFSVEASNLDGQPMKLFEAFFISSLANELRFRHTRKWVGEDGLPYREEFITGILHPREEKSRTTQSYEYDPNIKIEAPVK